MADQPLPAWVEGLAARWRRRAEVDEVQQYSISLAAVLEICASDLVAACPPAEHVPLVKHIRDENVAAHRALDRLNSPTVDGAGLTLGLKARIDWVREQLRSALREAALPPAVPAPQLEVQENKDDQSRRPPTEQP